MIVIMANVTAWNAAATASMRDDVMGRHCIAGAAGALGGGEHGVGEGRVEGSDAQVAGDDELVAQAALQRLADRRLRARPAREVPLRSVVLVLVDVVDQEELRGGDELGLEVEVEVDRQQQAAASQPAAVENRPWALDDRAGGDDDLGVADRRAGLGVHVHVGRWDSASGVSRGSQAWMRACGFSAATTRAW